MVIQQQASRGLHEKAVTLRGNRIKKSLDYTKVENPLYVSQNAGEAHNEPIKDDGLVKHMGNLPGYLQRVEKDENIQGKALNFGVLDWGRLENWKSNEKRIPPRYNMKNNNPTLVESASSKFSRNKNKIRPPRRGQQSSNGSPLNSPGARWPRGKPVKAHMSFSSPCTNDLPPGSNNHMVGLDSNKGNQADQTSSLSVDNINQDHLIEVNESRLSNCFSAGDFEPLSPCSDVPHSCPFPLPLTAELECPNVTPVTPLRGGSLKENIKKSYLDIDEHPALKGRQPSSPNRRFSFSLGKMARSFSFKESTSSDPQLSPSYISVKSGPLNFAASPDLVNLNWKKGNAINPSRSSPLRRFLDPLLKLKGSPLTEKGHKSKPNINPANVASIKESEFLHSKKHRLSNVQALLQLTLKNGIPFFKLVVESSSDILAAAVKKLPSGKDDSSLIYAFYSVHETAKKKSGGWIYQGSKEKSYLFEYNIVGQMKISSSYHAEFSGTEKDLYVVRESVLYSTDDQKTLDCMLDGELAAIIVKNPSNVTSGDIGSSKSTVVIIPEGVHSWPNNGLPSPLINRWRCGGACDCGGWDIGCQFHVLGHQNEIIKTSTPSSTTSDRLDLCYQVGHKNKCSFRLVSLEDGLYSLEYDASMSLLQAFSICVAVVSSQKLSHVFQVNYVPESKDLSKPIPAGDEKVETQKEYFTKPPASPVSRV